MGNVVENCCSQNHDNVPDVAIDWIDPADGQLGDIKCQVIPDRYVQYAAQCCTAADYMMEEQASINLTDKGMK